MSRIVLGKSDIHGTGIFANRNFHKGEFIATLKGRLVHRVYKRPAEYRDDETWVPIALNWWIEPIFPMLYLNHSCNPSAGFKTPRRLYAIRDIHSGEEITADYSTIEYVPFWKISCTCDVKECRKTIRSVQFLPKPIYQRHLPYIPRFLRKVYHSSRKAGK